MISLRVLRRKTCRTLPCRLAPTPVPSHTATPRKLAMAAKNPIQTIPFGGSHKVIDREGEGQRKDSRYFSNLIEKSDVDLVLFHDLKPLSIQTDTSIDLTYLPAQDTLSALGITDLVRENETNAMDFVVLGTGKNNERPVMALELSSRQHADGVSLEQESVLEKLRNTGLISSKQGNEYAQFVEGRKFLVTAARPMQEQERDDLSVFSMSRGYLAWHAQSRFCGHDGSRTFLLEGDPVAIMAVEHPTEEKLLLARGHKHPKGFVSCLAGFMEPGETIEDAVRREVLEETGISVDSVQYFLSQPWPLPRGAAFGQLMIGCFGKATNDNIVAAPGEIEQAEWIPLDQIKTMVEKSETMKSVPKNTTDDAEWSIPGQFAVAHHIIKGWVQLKHRRLPVTNLYDRLWNSSASS